MAYGNSDFWHFIFDDQDGSWTWQRVSPSSGEEVARSAFSFRSFNVCVADAELAGFVKSTNPPRRIRTSELGHGTRGRTAHAREESRLRSVERRRRPRHAA